MKFLWLGACLVGASSVANAAELKARRLPASPLVRDAVIVGRAVCSESTWLLTDTPQLVRVRSDGATVVQKVTGLAAGDRPWGLACLSDRTLWTIAAARAIARLDDVGHVAERIPVQLPRVAQFGAGARLLFQQLPIVEGTAALMTSPPRQPYAVKPWPGLNVREPAPREDETSRNLALCGINLGSEVPCWLAPDGQFTVSDGATSRAVDFPALRSMSVDREAPIRDVALATASHFWLLAGGRDPELGRPSGVRVFRAQERSSTIMSLDLKPAARILLHATESRCLLLAVDGSVVEVVVTP